MSNFNDDLFDISGCDNPSRRGDVIFVHGLGGNARGTWHPQERHDDNNFWPAWLGEDFPDVGIWSLGYEVKPFKWKGNSMPLTDRATNTLDLLDSYEIGDRPLIFITHSMGGLLVKQMLRNARSYGRWKAIASQTKGIVFLSTPHSGSDMASWIKYIGGILRTTVSVEELEAHHPQLRDLNLLYRNDEEFTQIPMLVYCETRPTQGVLVVNQISADPGIRGVIPIPMDLDHIAICKVADKKSQIYRQVKRFLQQSLTTPLAPIALREIEERHQQEVDNRFLQAEMLKQEHIRNKTQHFFELGMIRAELEGSLRAWYGKPININKANFRTILNKFPGINQVTAKAIVNNRPDGGYQSFEELVNLNQRSCPNAPWDIIEYLVMFEGSFESLP